MNKKTGILILLAGVMAGGISFWFNPYNEMTLGGVHIYTILAVGIFVISLILPLVVKEKPMKIVLWIYAGIMISLLLRAIFDITFIDRASHNLAPFEFILSSLVAFPAAFAGAYAGRVIRRLCNRQLQ